MLSSAETDDISEIKFSPAKPDVINTSVVITAVNNAATRLICVFIFSSSISFLFSVNSEILPVLSDSHKILHKQLKCRV